MSQARVLRFQDLADRLQEFDAIIDVRSPAEFADDHLPGAINLPVLDDAERVRIGTLHKSSPFEARRAGAALVARNIAAHLETVLTSAPRGWRPLVYCWRGGQRSGAMSTVLASVGWGVVQLEGGYKAYRNAVVNDLAELPASIPFHVLCGPTGSGKSRLLAALAEIGEQVLDLEALAGHRGSVLGAELNVAQPGQRAFESSLWRALRKFDPRWPVYVEAESRKLGRLEVPGALHKALRSSPCVVVDLAREQRARLLQTEYAGWTENPAMLAAALQKLTPLHGRSKIAEWLALVEQQSWPELVAALLSQHYDPAYASSMRKDFRRLEDARGVTIASIDARDFIAAARMLTGREDPAS